MVKYLHNIISSKKIECCVFFTQPYTSWENGYNENFYGLIKQYFRKLTINEILNLSNKALINHNR